MHNLALEKSYLECQFWPSDEKHMTTHENYLILNENTQGAGNKITFH